jgi:hypothetical protein
VDHRPAGVPAVEGGEVIRPGAIRVEVVERPDGGAEFVGDAFYCVAMYARARRRQRPSLEALVSEALHEAMATELPCQACGDWRRHVPLPGERPLYRCGVCTGVREFVHRRAVVADWQPTEHGAQRLLFLLVPPPAPPPRHRLARGTMACLPPVGLPVQLPLPEVN